jgi:hypothetical protein
MRGPERFRVTYMQEQSAASWQLRNAASHG